MRIVHVTKGILFTVSLLIVLSASDCDEQNMLTEEPVKTNTGVAYDTVTFKSNFRDDLPPFNVLQSRAALDTTTLTECELRLYRATRRVYCWETDTYWKFRICGLDFDDNPEDPRPWAADDRAYMESMRLFQEWVYEHRETEKACKIEPDYFETLFGEPTTTTTNNGRQYFTYFYHYTARWRRSPCPDVYDNPPNEYSYRENPLYTQMCTGLLKVQFGLQDSVFQGLQYF